MIFVGIFLYFREGKNKIEKKNCVFRHFNELDDGLNIHDIFRFDFMHSLTPIYSFRAIVSGIFTQDCVQYLLINDNLFFLTIIFYVT